MSDGDDTDQLLHDIRSADPCTSAGRVLDLPDESIAFPDDASVRTLDAHLAALSNLTSGSPAPRRDATGRLEINFQGEQRQSFASVSALLAFQKSASKAQYTWIDFSRPSDEDLNLVGTAFNLHPLTVEDLQAPTLREKLELFPGQYLLLSLRALSSSTTGYGFITRGSLEFIAHFTFVPAIFALQWRSRNVLCQDLGVSQVVPHVS